jgi:hypothetical protein
MRTHQIQSRLRKLEARTRSWPTREDKLRRFLGCVWVVSIAYYLDEPQPDEPLISFHRICGFQSKEEFQNVFRNGSPGALAPRLGPVLDQLLGKFGVIEFTQYAVDFGSG